LPLVAHRDEILLTMAQSIYACASILDLEYGVRNGAVLFGLWLFSTVFIEARFWVSIVFLVLALLEVGLHRGRITAFSSFRETVGRYLLKRD